MLVTSRISYALKNSIPTLKCVISTQKQIVLSRCQVHCGHLCPSNSLCLVYIALSSVMDDVRLIALLLGAAECW